LLASLDERVRAGLQRPYLLFDWQRPKGQEGSAAIDISV
jgi:hypothetical protein